MTFARLPLHHLLSIYDTFYRGAVFGISPPALSQQAMYTWMEAFQAVKTLKEYDFTFITGTVAAGP